MIRSAVGEAIPRAWDAGARWGIRAYFGAAGDGHFSYIIPTLLDIICMPAPWRCNIQPTFGSTTV